MGMIRFCLFILALVWTAIANAGSASDMTYMAKPVSSQLPGAQGPGTRTFIHASLWFSKHLDRATIALPKGVSGARLYCAAAGQEGSEVWQQTGVSTAEVYKLMNDSISPVLNSPSCPVELVNVAALRQAADQRLLYVQFEFRGETVRGQLWPRRVSNRPGYIDVSTIAGASSAQEVSSISAPPSSVKDTVQLRFNEFDRDLTTIQYSLGRRLVSHWYSIELMCGPPGLDGVVITELTGFGGLLTNDDVRISEGLGACGAPINNLASIFEAYLRGNLYVRMTRGEVPPQLERYPMHLRGQFPTP